MELRRFRMKGKNDPDEFFAWCARKGLSREDLMLILASVELGTSVEALPTYPRALSELGRPLKRAG